MKRRILALAIALLLVCLVFSLSSCGECEHSFGAWETKTAATCVTEGVMVRTCTECGESEEGVIEKTAHTFTTYVSDDNATCSSDGTKSAVCDNCDAKDTQPLEGSKKPHSFTNYIDDNNATCSRDATKTAVCDRDGCGATHSIVIENSKVDHELSVTENAPSCTDEAVIITSCANCNYSVSETVPALGHDWSAEKPTCEEGIFCNRCEASVPALLHTYELKSSTEADCDDNGVDIYACSLCGDEYETVREYATGHVSGDNWTLSDETLAEGESCVYVQTYTSLCTLCGDLLEREEEVEKHVYTSSIKTVALCNADGVKLYTCTKGCGDSYEEAYSDAQNHKWDEGVVSGRITTYTCSGCSETKKTVSSKEDTSATVDKDTLLDAGEVELKDASIALDSDTLSGLSGNVSISADKLLASDVDISDTLKNTIGNRPIYNFGMSMDGSAVESFGGYVTVRVPYILDDGEDPECIAVWYIDADGEVHSIKATYSDGYAVFETNHFSYYTVTRLTPEERCALYGHSYKLTVKAPGCTSEGYTLSVCQRCGDSKKSDILLATGHSFAKTEVDPTCTLAGSVSYLCSGCGVEYFEKIPAIGHSYKVTAENEATCTEPGRVVNTCENCQDEYIEIEPKIPHAYVDSVTEPTCTTEGYTERVCSVCNNKVTENYKEPLGHNYIETVVEATCLTDGYTLHQCERCDSEYSTDVVAASHKWDIPAPTCGNGQICLVCGGKGAEATGEHNMVDGICSVCGQGCQHSYTDSIVSPTCTKEGYTLKTCNLCGVTEKTNIVAALGHKGSGTCTVCGASLEASFYENTFNSLLTGDFVINMTDFYYGSEVYSAGYYITVHDLYYSLDAEGEMVAYGRFAYRSEGDIKSSSEANFYVKGGKIYAKTTDTGSSSFDTTDAFIVTELDSILNTAPASILMIESFLKFYRRDLADVISIIAVTMGSSVEEVTSTTLEWLFTVENKGDGKQFIFNFERLKEINNYLYENKVSAVIELIIGEGRFESFKDGIEELLSAPLSDVPARILESGMALSDAERILDALVSALSMGEYSRVVDALKTVVEGDYETLSDFLKTDYAKTHRVIEVVSLINIGGSNGDVNDRPSGDGDITVHAHYDADGDKICDYCGIIFVSGGGSDITVHVHYDADGDKVCDHCGMTFVSGDGSDVTLHKHYDYDGDATCDFCGMNLASGDNGADPDIGDDHNGNGAAPDTGDQNNGAAPDPVLPPVADNNAHDKSRSVSYSYSASYGDSYSDGSSDMGSSNIGSSNKEESETGTDYDKLIENVVKRIEAFGEMNAYELIAAMFVSGESGVSLSAVKESVDEIIDGLAEKTSFSIKTDNSGNVTEIKLSFSDYKLEDEDGESIDGSVIISSGEGDRAKYEAIINEVILGMKDAPSLDGILSDYEVERDEEYINASQKTSFVHESFEHIMYYADYYEVTYKNELYTSFRVAIPVGKSFDYVADGCGGKVYVFLTAEYEYRATRQDITYRYSYDGTLIDTYDGGTYNGSGSGNSVAVRLTEDGRYVFYPMSAAFDHNYEYDHSKFVAPTGCLDYGERHLVCKDCGKTAVTYFRNGHTLDLRYTLLGDSCEDGYIEKGVCTVCGELIYEVTLTEHDEWAKSEDLTFAGLCEHHNITLTSCVCGEYIRLDYDGFEYGKDYETRACGECGYALYMSETSRREGCTVYHDRIYTIKNASGVTVFSDKGVLYSSSEHDYDAQLTLKPGAVSCEDGVQVKKVCRDCGKTDEYSTNWHETHAIESIDLTAYGVDGRISYVSCACGKHRSLQVTSDDDYDLDYQKPEGNVEGLTCDSIARYTFSSGLIIDVKHCYEKRGCEIKNYAFIFIEGERVARFEESTTYEHVMSGEATLNGDSCTDGVTVKFTCVHCGASSDEKYSHHASYLKEIIIFDSYGSVCGGYIGITGCACGQQETYISTDYKCDFDERMVYWEDSDNNLYVYTCAVTSPKCGFRYAIKRYSVNNGCEEAVYMQILVGCNENGENAKNTFTYTIRSKSNHVVDCYKPGSKTRDVVCSECNQTLDGVIMESWIRHTGKAPKQKDNGDGTITYYSGDYCSDCGVGSYWTANKNGDTIYNYDSYVHLPDSDRYEIVVQETFYVEHEGDMYRDVIQYSYRTYLFKGAKFVKLEDDNNESEEYLYFFEEGFASAYRQLMGREYNLERDGCKRITYGYKGGKGYIEDACITVSGWAEATCTQDGEDYDICNHCGKGYKDVYEYARGHKWKYDRELSLYVCISCGLESANGADGDIAIEDLTYKYGNDETYVVGYMNRKGIEFLTSITLILANGDEVLIECVEFTYLDTGRLISFSRTAVEDEARKLGYSPDEYDIRISFVPVGAGTDLDYAITFK